MCFLGVLMQSIFECKIFLLKGVGSFSLTFSLCFVMRLCCFSLFARQRAGSHTIPTTEAWRCQCRPFVVAGAFVVAPQSITFSLDTHSAVMQKAKLPIRSMLNVPTPPSLGIGASEAASAVPTRCGVECKAQLQRAVCSSDGHELLLYHVRTLSPLPKLEFVLRMHRFSCESVRPSSHSCPHLREGVLRSYFSRSIMSTHVNWKDRVPCIFSQQLLVTTTEV